ncbi:MAG TPA: hypothetical protein VLH85_05130 [Levilinea sp.]|nr:hypothetical protein [Levilinea sp.]
MQFEITEDVEQFACSGCGMAYIVKRSGGMVRLVKAPALDERARLRQELKALEQALKVEMDCELGGMPGYLLLRFDLAKIGKLHMQFATVTPEKIVRSIFINLTVSDLGKLAALYEKNPNSPTGAWLKRMRDLKVKIQQIQAQLARTG